jgi:hypothetical protein
MKISTELKNTTNPNVNVYYGSSKEAILEEDSYIEEENKNYVIINRIQNDETTIKNDYDRAC